MTSNRAKRPACETAAPLCKPVYNNVFNSLVKSLEDQVRMASIVPYGHAKGPRDPRIELFGFMEAPDARYPLLRVTGTCSEGMEEGPILIVTAGFHGNEIAGPLTLKNCLFGMLVAAQRNGLNLIVYPCMNPWGFEHFERYNAWNESPNNDFLRYIMPDATLNGDLGGDKSKAVSWGWVDEVDPTVRLARESHIMLREVRSLPLERVVGFIDLHQDRFPSSYQHKPATYAYVFGDRSRYSAIIREVQKIVPVLSCQEITAGQEEGVPGPVTDSNGFLTRHDGTLQDAMDNLGVSTAVTVETTGATSLADAIKANITWIKGMIELISK